MTPTEALSRHEIDENGCWLWVGALLKHRGGYGELNIGGRVLRAHRFYYESLVGPIPAGYHIDHLCRVPRCVNPAHLEPVPPAVNTGRGKKPRCRRGHLRTAENSYPRPDGKGFQCRACIRYRSRVGLGACRVEGCSGRSGRPGTSRGYCVKHHARFRKNGLCEAIGGCEAPAVSHLGLCEAHTPRGLPR